MATLVTTADETYEFEKVRACETGEYLCYSDDEPGESPDRLFPEQSVREVISDAEIERTARLVHEKDVQPEDEPIDIRGPPQATRVLVETVVR